MGEVKLIEIDNSFLADNLFVNLEEAVSFTFAGLDMYYSANLLARLR